MDGEKYDQYLFDLKSRVPYIQKTQKIIGESIMSDKQNPYIDENGNVIIPFNSDPQYHFWKGGQILSDTLREMKVTEDIWKKHSEKSYS